LRKSGGWTRPPLHRPLRHALQPGLKVSGRLGRQNASDPAVIAKCMLNFIASGKKLDSRMPSDHALHCSGEVQNRVTDVRSDVENLVVSRRNGNRPCNYRCDIGNIRKSPRLLSVAEDRARHAPHYLVHEYPNHVSILVCYILSLTIYIVRTKYDGVKAKLPSSGRQIKLHRILRDPIRVLRTRDHFFSHRRLSSAIHGDA